MEYDQEYYGTVNLLLYYDSDTQWPAVYKTNKVRIIFFKNNFLSFVDFLKIIRLIFFFLIFQTCVLKEKVLNIEQNQIVNLTSDYHDSGCVVQKGRSTGKGGITIPSTVLCKQVRRFRSSRERWWFIAVSNCKSVKVGLNSKIQKYLEKPLREQTKSFCPI